MKKKGLLLVNSFLKSEKFTELYEFLKAAAQENCMTLDAATSSAVFLPCGETHEKAYDFVLSWDKDLPICRSFEREGVPVFNSSFAIGCCDDKAFTAEQLTKQGIPTPKTVIAPKTFSNIGYNDFSFLYRTETFLEYPMVIKHRCGSFGAQVYLAKDRASAEKILSSCGGNEVILQQFISESSGRDVRINVVGEEICGCMRRSNRNDFRSNITNGGKMENFDPPREYKELAVQATKAVGADFAGVDVLFGKEGPVICEVNASPHFKTTYLSTGVNLASKILKYILQKIS